MKQAIKLKLLNMLMGKEAMAKQVSINAHWDNRAPLTAEELESLRITNGYYDDK